MKSRDDVISSQFLDRAMGTRCGCGRELREDTMVAADDLDSQTIYECLCGRRWIHGIVCSDGAIDVWVMVAEDKPVEDQV